MEKEDVDSYWIHNDYCVADEVIASGSKRVGLRGCESSDAMAIYENEPLEGEVFYTGYCRSCNQFFSKEEVHASSHASELGVSDCGEVKERKKFERKPKQPRITRAQIQEIMAYGYKSKNIRGIKDKYNQFFGHITKMGKDGKPKVRFYPETSDEGMMGYKSRTFEGKKFGYENCGITGVKNHLSGQAKFADMHFRDICIVGGEEDKAAFFQQFDEYQIIRNSATGNEYAPMPVVSPTTGEGSVVNQVRNNYDFVNRAERIFIGLDNDKAGREAAEALAKIFPPEKVFIIHWSYKDPNNAIDNKEGKDYSAQTIRDFYNAKPYTASSTKSSKKLKDSVRTVLLKKRITLPSYMDEISKMMGGDSGEVGMLQNVICNIIGNTSVGKCHGVDTPIRMADMSVKMVQDIVVGDKVMGADGSPRTVLNTVTGQDQLYRVDQIEGMSYVVNSAHKLSLRAGYTIGDGNPHKCSVKASKGDIHNVEVKDFIKYPYVAKRSLKGYKGILTNLDNGVEVKHPWLVGMWLGDGTASKPDITQDRKALETLDEIVKVSKEHGYVAKLHEYKPTTYTITITEGFRGFLRQEGLLSNKHIPQEWLCANWESRVELLSGLLDSDGYYMRGHGYEITQKSKQLAEDIVILAKSLGFKCSINKTTKSTQDGAVGEYYRMFISGDTSILNLRLGYKQAEPISELRKLANTAISVTELGEGDYYGFEIDGDHLYCLEDFTVTHNSSHVNGMVHHWIMNSPQKPVIASLEATDGQYALEMISIHLGENVRKGRTGQEVLDYLDTPEIEERLSDLWENEWGEERFQIIDERDGSLATLEKQLEVAFHRDGCGLMVIDVLTDALRNLSNEEQANHMAWQKNMVKKGATIINVLHTTKPKRDSNGKMIPITEYDAYGSSTFVQSAAINILIDRDKMTDDVIEKNTTRVRMPKCREGHTGDAGEWFYDVMTRKVYDRNVYFRDNPHLLPDGYDLTINPYARAANDDPVKSFSKKAGGNKPKQDEPDFMDAVAV